MSAESSGSEASPSRATPWWHVAIAVVVGLIGLGMYTWFYFAKYPPLLLVIPSVIFLAAAYWAGTQFLTYSVLSQIIALTAIAVAAAAIPLVTQDKDPKPEPKPKAGPSSSVRATGSPNNTPTSGGTTAPVSSPRLQVTPDRGPSGSTFTVSGQGFPANTAVRVMLEEGPGLTNWQGPYIVRDATTSANGAFTAKAFITGEICCSGGSVAVAVYVPRAGISARADFLLTG